jgi:hypothetical protein
VVEIVTELGCPVIKVITPPEMTIMSVQKIVVIGPRKEKKK